MLETSSFKIKNYLIKNRKYAKKVIFQHYSFSLAELMEYESYLDWDVISLNGNIKWDYNILHQFKDKLNWKGISKNGAVFKNIELIDEFIDVIHWQDPNQSFFSTIANNEGIFWSDELIKKYAHLLDFYQLSYNDKGVAWSEELIDRHINDWHWVQLGAIENLPWSISFFEKYVDLFNINYFLFEVNPTLTGNIEFIEKYYNILESWAIFANDKLPWHQEKLLERWEDKINWYGVAGNTLLLGDLDFFERHIDRWIHLTPKAFNMLSRNTGIPWSIELIEKYKSHWDWKRLSQNESLPWSIEFIEYFKDDLLWAKVTIDDNDYDENGQVIYDSGMIFETIEEYMTSNPALPWSIDFILHFGNEIDPDTLGTNYEIWKKAFEPYVTPDMLNDIITNYWSLKYLSTDNGKID